MRVGSVGIDTYHDAAISSASVILRPGVQSLLQDAQRGKFDLVLAGALDRVSRDQAEWRRCSSISALPVCRS
ncbi:MAG: recombinase family protein [Rhizobiales bacterium]|nr:recombinase family protein [Hyphomicrobiales bacterium]